MADREDGSEAPDHAFTSSTSTPGMPRWVKGFVIAAVVLAVVLVVALVTGGGSHGPGRHGLGTPWPAAWY